MVPPIYLLFSHWSLGKLFNFKSVFQVGWFFQVDWTINYATLKTPVFFWRPLQGHVLQIFMFQDEGGRRGPGRAFNVGRKGWCFGSYCGDWSIVTFKYSEITYITLGLWSMNCEVCWSWGKRFLFLCFLPYGPYSMQRTMVYLPTNWYTININKSHVGISFSSSQEFLPSGTGFPFFVEVPPKFV